MFVATVIGFLVAFALVLANRRKAAIALAIVLMVPGVALYFMHDFGVNWAW